MKKLLSLVLVIGLVISLFGCSNNLEINYAETTKTENINSVVETTAEETTSVQNVNETTSMQNVNETQSLVNENNGRYDMKPIVYFTKEISSHKMVEMLQKLN